MLLIYFSHKCIYMFKINLFTFKKLNKKLKHEFIN